MFLHKLRLRNHTHISHLMVHFRVPALGGKQRESMLKLKAMLFPERDLDMEVDWSLMVDKNIYYQFYKIMPTACLEMSILEIWGYNSTLYATLTDEDVVNAINTITMRQVVKYVCLDAEREGVD